jgi:threonine aldolase
VQVLTHLYATSAVTAATYDAARMVAGHDAVTTEEAEDHVRALLGDYGHEVTFDWSGTTADQVALRVAAPTPARLVQGLAEVTGQRTIERTVHVRIEELR